MNTQKGQVPESIKSANYPLDVREGQYQRETKRDKAYVLDTGDGRLPTITLETKQSGKIGSTPTVSERQGSGVSELRHPMDENFGPDQNFHDQYVKPDSIEPDDRLR